MTEVAFTDASGNVRLRGTIEPPPGGSALTVTDGSTPVADVTEILFVGAVTGDNGGGIAEVDIPAPGLAAVLNEDPDGGGNGMTNTGGITTGGSDIDAGGGQVTGVADPSGADDAAPRDWLNDHVGGLKVSDQVDGVLNVVSGSVGSPVQAAFVANGSTVDQLRDSLIAAGFMAAS